MEVSKYLSLHLRHQPARLGLTLAAGGWVAVDLLLQRSNESGFAISRSELEEVVTLSDKKRFSFDETGRLIRANQGHSVAIQIPGGLKWDFIGVGLHSVRYRFV